MQSINQSRVFPVQVGNDAVEKPLNLKEQKDIESLEPLLKPDEADSNSYENGRCKKQSLTDKDIESEKNILIPKFRLDPIINSSTSPSFIRAGKEVKLGLGHSSAADSDKDRIEVYGNEKLLQRLMENMETLKPLLEKEEKKKKNAKEEKSVEAVLQIIESRGWEVTGPHNLTHEELLKRLDIDKIPCDDVAISNGFYEARINSKNPKFVKIINDIELMNKTSEKEVVIGQDDVDTYEIEEVEVESSNSLLYLSGIDHYTKFIGIFVLLTQVAMFFICFQEAYENDTIEARNDTLVITRIFVAMAFSFLMTMSFTDSWLAMATSLNCAGHLCNDCNYVVLVFAMPSIIGGVIVNSFKLIIGVFFQGLFLVFMGTLQLLYNIAALLSCNDQRDWSKLLLSQHFISKFLTVPVAFILESAINVFAFMAVLVVTKQLGTAIDTVANFAGLMTILELDQIVIMFIKLEKLQSLKVEKDEAPKANNKQPINSPAKGDKSIGRSEKEEIGGAAKTAPHGQLLLESSTNDIEEKTSANKDKQQSIEMKEQNCLKSSDAHGDIEQAIPVVEEKTSQEKVSPANQDIEKPPKTERDKLLNTQENKASLKEEEKPSDVATEPPSAVLDVHRLRISIFLYLFAMSAVYLLL